MASRSEPYEPSINDVFVVKATLRTIHKKSPLPLELIDTIIDFAEYWPHTTTTRRGGTLRLSSGTFRENKFLLRSYPLGYVPRKDNPTVCQIGSRSEFPTIRPILWSFSGDFPQNETQGVIDRWTKESLIRGEHPCRKIVFTIKSHDQGWGHNMTDKGTYKGSYTWFDVGLEKTCAFRDNQLSVLRDTGGIYSGEVEKDWLAGSVETYVDHLPKFDIPSFDQNQLNSTTKPIVCTVQTVLPTTSSRQTVGDNPHTEYSFDHLLLPSDTCLQKNVTIRRDTKEHKITWSYEDNVVPDSIEAQALVQQGRGKDTGNGEYVRNLKIGDVVTVWGKARFPGWVNNVEEVKIDVYWAV